METVILIFFTFFMHNQIAFIWKRGNVFCNAVLNEYIFALVFCNEGEILEMKGRAALQLKCCLFCLI